MSVTDFDYVIVGGGAAGASAIEGIRERDPSGSILLCTREPHLPYDRPPLTKSLWFGGQKQEEIFLHDEGWYADRGVTLLPCEAVCTVAPTDRALVDPAGRRYGYGKLLLATGGTPRRLAIPGATLAGVEYFRTLDDYQRTRGLARAGETAVVVGGGFIGTELAAALAANRMRVVQLFPEDHPLGRVLPPSMGRAVADLYRSRGIELLAGDVPVAMDKRFDRCLVRTRGGREIEAALVVVGAGIVPNTQLAATAGLQIADGVLVDSRLRTSDRDIYAAGDVARFPYAALGKVTRVEHWDNAIAQGRLAGRNMAGGDEPYEHLPMFYSDMFELGFEAVGELDPKMELVESWQEPGRTGVVYYLSGGRVRGVLLCNVQGKLDAAREMIRRGTQARREELLEAMR